MEVKFYRELSWKYVDGAKCLIFSFNIFIGLIITFGVFGLLHVQLLFTLEVSVFFFFKINSTFKSFKPDKATL